MPTLPDGRALRVVAVLLFAFLALPMPAVARPQVPAPAPAQAASTDPSTGALKGITTTQTTIPLGGVLVSLFDGSAELTHVVSESDGSYKFQGLKPGRYTVTAVLDGFESTTKPALVNAGTTLDLPLDMRLAGFSSQIEVIGGNTDAVVPQTGTLSSTEAVDKKELEQISPGGGVQSALRLIAGVIEVPGGVAIKGGRPSQAGMQLGPGMFVDAATGLSQGTLPDDAIDTVTVLPNPYAVEFGRFSSGLVVIQTRRATDHWRTRVNQLEPAFRVKRGNIFDVLGIASFYPRL